MSSPSYLSVCCCHSDDDPSAKCTDLEKTVLMESSVNMACLTTGVISLFGIIYLLLPRPDSDLRNTLSTSQTRILVGKSVREIIHILVVCDILAILGVISRSTFILLKGDSLSFCLFINLWIQFFFLCTYFWNIVYGVELIFSVKNIQHVYIKYVIGFCPPVILIVVQVVMAYISPNKWCVGNGIEKTFVYLAGLLPISFVILLNPVLYYTILKSVRKLMIRNLGRFSSPERKVLDAAKLKFTLILIIFIFCWIPNILFAVLQTFEDKLLMHDVFLAVAIIQSIMNPLQGCLNCVVYRGWPGIQTTCSLLSVNNNVTEAFTPEQSSTSPSKDLEESIEVRINSITSRFAADTRTENDPFLNFRSERRTEYT